ncbi:neuronal acetylcholine receptor subunit alpha-6 [Crotalus adamanteus]|uniref:Neuronal acetylcholine receptor subunit alpha-6 n=1 Tax=Crotalus adamanteus TaxID=8729 RepID=A0AAW1C0W5_CROAD
MPNWVKTVFLGLLPKFLMMKRPIQKHVDSQPPKPAKESAAKPSKPKADELAEVKVLGEHQCCHCDNSKDMAVRKKRRQSCQSAKWEAESIEYSPEVKEVINSVQFIAENMRSQNETKEVRALRNEID